MFRRHRFKDTTAAAAESYNLERIAPVIDLLRVYDMATMDGFLEQSLSARELDDAFLQVCDHVIGLLINLMDSFVELPLGIQKLLSFRMPNRKSPYPLVSDCVFRSAMAVGPEDEPVYKIDQGPMYCFFVTGSRNVRDDSTISSCDPKNSRLREVDENTLWIQPKKTFSMEQNERDLVLAQVLMINKLIGNIYEIRSSKKLSVIKKYESLKEELSEAILANRVFLKHYIGFNFRNENDVQLNSVRTFFKKIRGSQECPSPVEEFLVASQRRFELFYLTHVLTEEDRVFLQNHSEEEIIKAQAANRLADRFVSVAIFNGVTQALLPSDREKVDPFSVTLNGDGSITCSF